MLVNEKLANLVGVGQQTNVLATQAPKLKPLSQLLEDNGYTLRDASRLTTKVCRQVAGGYRASHNGDNPPKAPTLVNGRVCGVMQYTQADWDDLVKPLVLKYLRAHPVLDW